MITLLLWLSRIKSFIADNWRIILPLVIVGYCLFSWNSAVKRADAAEQALSDLKAEIQREADTQRLKNALKKTEGENRAKSIALEHNEALKRLGLAELDRVKLQSKLRAYQNETTYYQNRIDDTNRNWAERMRLEADRSGAGMPEEPQDYCDPAHTGFDCDETAYRKLTEHFENLRQACQATTVDLVACLQVVESDTEAVGRYE
jgi:hypothetical protein